MRLSKDNKPMRNFNCNGFRCLKTDTTHPLNEDLPEKELTTDAENKKYNYIDLDGNISNNITYSKDNDNNLNLVNQAVTIV